MKRHPSALSVTESPWGSLQQFSQARIALGRAGTSLPTAAQLDFQLAHARARDAVQRPLDVEFMSQALAQRSLQTLVLHSAAGDRQIYLQRPDQGRRLDRDSRQVLLGRGSNQGGPWDAVFVIVDGLSALAIEENVAPFLDEILPLLGQEGWCLAPTVLVEQGRVAIGDEVAEVMQVPLVVVLIGERPGLSSPDSLGIYLTFDPRIGMSDAQRNCISNVRREGLSYAGAAHKLYYLMNEARRRKLTGVMLKDETEALPRLASASVSNFLTAG